MKVYQRHEEEEKESGMLRGAPIDIDLPGDGRFKFREYEPRDKKVVGILRAIAHHEEPTPEWEKPPSDKLTHHTVVVEDTHENSRVVAAARVIVTEPRLSHLQFVCVEEERRGLGLGTALLRWVDDTSWERCGAWAVELEVEAHNARAQELYGRQGYSHVPEHSAAERAWFSNPAIRRMLGAPKVLRYVKNLPRKDRQGD